MTLLTTATPSARAALLAALCFICYNVNGREMGSYDSQPPKFLAREILLRHTLTLDATVAAVPPLAERPGFVKTQDGHYRSAYSIAPAVAAAVVGWPLAALHVIDLDGPQSPNLIAKLTASLLSSVAVGFAFLTARRYASDALAAVVAVGLGLGTNVWALASQTLWQHECVLAGISIAVFVLTRPADVLPLSMKGASTSPAVAGRASPTSATAAPDAVPTYADAWTQSALWIASAGLGLAGWARPQVAPAISVLALCLIARATRDADAARHAGPAHQADSARRADSARQAGPAHHADDAPHAARARHAIALVPLALFGALALWINLRWFGHPLGAVPLLEALHPVHHAVDGSIARDPWWGAMGLLFSPSRGLVIFSPIVLVALLSLPRAWQEGGRGTLGWLWLAAILQFTLYAFYSVWWAGHTYGPRYLIDLLPLLVPLAAAGATRLARTRAGATAGAIALAWSILVAATGAFCYPADAWNTDPVSVDREHARLWAWNDPQFVRCWRRGTSPQNFSFLEEDAFTAPARRTGP